MVLVIQLWNFKNTRRKNEVYRALMKNCRNRYIKKILIFVEGSTPLHLKHNKIITIKTKQKLSWYDMFFRATQNFKNYICILSNADIYFDGTISKLHAMDLDDKVVALTSYDSETNEIDDYSVDSWVIKGMDINYNNYSEMFNFKLGDKFSDLKLMNYFLDKGVKVINPSLDIYSYHIDSEKKLKGLDKPSYKFANPSKSSEKSIIRNDHNNKQTEDKLKELVSESISNSIKKKIKIVDRDAKKNVKDPKGKKVVKNTGSKKIAVILHLYYQDLWGEFKNKLDNLKGQGFDLYVTLTKGVSTLGQQLWIKEKIEEYGGKVFLLENKGLDIGPFLYVVRYLLQNDISYDYVLKIHTKKSLQTAGFSFGRRWRSQLIDSLIGSKEKVDYNLRYLSDDKVGMLGDKDWVTNNKQGNDEVINHFIRMLNLKRGRSFVGGTMFWVKWDTLTKYFTEEHIDNIYPNLESNYFHDHDNPTKTHSLERILGYIIEDDNKIIKGV